MKHKTYHLYYLFYPRSWIIIALLLFSSPTTAQEMPAPGFILSTGIADTINTNQNLFNSFVATGLNTVWQRADNNTKNMLAPYNLLACNAFSETEYIYHYSTAYYSKWEAEVDAEADRVGFKHRDSLGNLIGSSATWNGKSCWSSLGLSGPRDSLMYGPHYRQEKRYKRWHYGCYNEPGCVTYTPRFRMALDNHGGADPNEDVCIIKVVFRYKEDTTPYNFHNTTFIARTLKVEDFDTLGNFDYFYLHAIPDSGRYEYYPGFILPKDLAQTVGSSTSLGYIDWESFTGIQFWVDWLRDDTLCTLYIDYAEVYDNDGWNVFMGDSSIAAQAIQDIKDYAQSFSDWDNIKYWIGTNEPYTIDSYTPIHIVDSLIQSVNPSRPLIVAFNPTWWHTLDVNGENKVSIFYNITEQKNLMKDFYLKDLTRQKYLKFENMR